ncbi:hypothetical protein [Methanohalophilus sp.]
MKKVIFTLFLLFFFLSSTAFADIEISPTVAVNYSMEPRALLPGDIGTVTFEMQQHRLKNLIINHLDALRYE